MFRQVIGSCNICSLKALKAPLLVQFSSPHPQSEVSDSAQPAPWAALYTQHWTAHYTLHCTMYTALHNVHCTAQFTLHCTLNNAPCTAHYTLHWILHNTHYTANRTTQTTLCITQWTCTAQNSFWGCMLPSPSEWEKHCSFIWRQKKPKLGMFLLFWEGVHEQTFYYIVFSRPGCSQGRLYEHLVIDSLIN